MADFFEKLEKELKYHKKHNPNVPELACYTYLRVDEAEQILKLKAEIAKLNLILFHRENGLSHPDLQKEIEKSELAELKTENEALKLDNDVYAAKVDGSWPNEQIAKLEAENKRLKEQIGRRGRVISPEEVMNEVLTCCCGNQIRWEIAGNQITCMRCGRIYYFTEFLEFVINLPKDGLEPRGINPKYTLLKGESEVK